MVKKINKVSKKADKVKLDLPSYKDVLNAAKNLKGIVHNTPVLTSKTINKRLGGAQVFFKCENFQKTGAFKLRGAYNALYNLNTKQRKAGVVAYSCGSHALGVSLAGKLLGIKTTIFMPKDG